jgi:hypothetical protein
LFPSSDPYKWQIVHPTGIILSIQGYCLQRDQGASWPPSRFILKPLLMFVFRLFHSFGLLQL